MAQADRPGPATPYSRVRGGNAYIEKSASVAVAARGPAGRKRVDFVRRRALKTHWSGNTTSKFCLHVSQRPTTESNDCPSRVGRSFTGAVALRPKTRGFPVRLSMSKLPHLLGQSYVEGFILPLPQGLPGGRRVPLSRTTHHGDSTPPSRQRSRPGVGWDAERARS